MHNLCLIMLATGVHKQHCVTGRNFLNTQLMSMVFFYIFMADESESGMHFSPTSLDFAAHEVNILVNNRK